MQSAQNPKTSQSLIIIVLGLIIIFLGLNSYLFIINSNSNFLPNQNENATNFFELSALLSSNSADDVALAFGAKDLKPYLLEFSSNQTKITNKLLFVNPHKSNYYGELTEPITIDSSFRLLLNLDSQNTNSEIVISGKDNLQENKWWKEISQLRIGYNKEEKGYYLSLLNGQKEGSVWYQILENTQPGQSLILEFVNSQGQGFLVKNTAGQILAEINSSELNNLEMTQGLFPYSSMKIGINLPPNGKLKIKQLLFLAL